MCLDCPSHNCSLTVAGSQSRRSRICSTVTSFFSLSCPHRPLYYCSHGRPSVLWEPQPQKLLPWAEPRPQKLLPWGEAGGSGSSPQRGGRGWWLWELTRKRLGFVALGAHRPGRLEPEYFKGTAHANIALLPVQYLMTVWEVMSCQGQHKEYACSNLHRQGRLLLI